MKIITIAIRNGGTAKTNTAQHLAIGLKKEHNKKVLLIDLDTQTNLTDNVNANKEHKSIYDVLENECSVRDAIQHLSEIDIICASDQLSSYQLRDAKKVYLRPILEKLTDYDYIIIDTSPSVDVMTLSAIKSADNILIPIQTDKKSISGIMQIANELKALNMDTSIICGILMTRVKRNQNGTKLVKTYLENLAQMLNTKLFETDIRECAQVRDAELNGLSVYEYAPKSNASMDYKAFVKEFLERVENGK